MMDYPTPSNKHFLSLLAHPVLGTSLVRAVALIFSSYKIFGSPLP